jgi:anti-sigma regulatory factor (Ser/Thr protein kinase)
MIRQHEQRASWMFTVKLETDPLVIRVVRKVIAATARIGGAAEVEARLIEFSVGEALANARLHAYQNGIGPIEAAVTQDHEMFSVMIQNEGKQVTRDRGAVDTRDVQEAQGWGLYLIGQVMDEVEITRSELGDHGTAIRMTKRLDASTAPEARHRERQQVPASRGPGSGEGGASPPREGTRTDTSSFLR